ncbi:MAG: hypothetical protein Hyperionvirus11_65 [Hyperionvirus sp.]|uniref:Prolyl 4-hydroxylase alpha subunit domain-containing protein n=1 Tax=Hyperionvirus sp. TaxID=2487770 RepID=A0A3G5A9N8_9VIRU|nr:MAG: hypothetical protein Hyperionvirus11_65 [Hyperionvirus sp.]
MNKVLTDYVITIDNFLTDSECTRYIDLIDSTRNAKKFTTASDFKNAVYIDQVTSDLLYHRLKQFISANDQLNIITNNNLIAFGCYQPGQEFGIHTDTGLYYNNEKQLATTYTLLIYLNDNFNGGLTTFYDSALTEICSIIPKRGRALLFDIDLAHKGNKVQDNSKYWIGIEIIGRLT